MTPAEALGAALGVINSCSPPCSRQPSPTLIPAASGTGDAGISHLSTLCLPSPRHSTGPERTAQPVAEAALATGVEPYKPKKKRKAAVQANSSPLVGSDGLTSSSATSYFPHFTPARPAIEDFTRLARENASRKREEKREQETRKKERLEREHSGWTPRSSILADPIPNYNRYRYKPRGTEWTMRRFNQVMHMSGLLKVDVFEFGFLTADMSRKLEDLCIIACNQVLETDCNYKLQLACAPFWAFALAQESWRRLNPGGEWSISVENDYDNPQAVVDRVSWGKMEAIYEAVKGASTRVVETHFDEARESAKSTAEKTKGTKRVVCSHSLGVKFEDVRSKFDCLHRLLIEGGDRGLAQGIRNMHPPEVKVYPTPKKESSLTRRQQHCVSNHPLYGGGKASSP